MKQLGALIAAGGLLCAQLTASAATRFVNINNPTPTSPYTDWSTAATNIQDAINVALAGETVLVTNGLYNTRARAVYGMSNRVAVTKPVTVMSVNGPTVTQIVGYRMPTTTNGPAAVRCAYLTNGAVLSGFTLTNGATQSFGDTSTNRSGGGVWCEGVSGVVSNCVITGNSANAYGGGARSGTLNNCTVVSNSASSGGGAYKSTLNNCPVTGNVGGSVAAPLSHIKQLLFECELSTLGFWRRSAGFYPNYCVLTSNSTRVTPAVALTEAP